LAELNGATSNPNVGVRRRVTYWEDQIKKLRVNPKFLLDPMLHYPAYSANRHTNDDGGDDNNIDGNKGPTSASRDEIDDVDDDNIDDVDEKTPEPSNQMSEDRVFDLLSALRYCDRDEKVLNEKILNNIPREELPMLFEAMKKMAASLRTTLATQTGAVESMDETTRNNYLFHIIAKGRDFYLQTIVDAEFASYLIDNTQDLYEFMERRVNGIVS
jgi:hypothetical protein